MKKTMILSLNLVLTMIASGPVSAQVVTPIEWTHHTSNWQYSHTAIDNSGDIHAFGRQFYDFANACVIKLDPYTGEQIGAHTISGCYGGNGGLDRFGNPYLFYFEDDWYDFIGFKINKVATNYDGSELFFSHETGTDGSPPLWPLGAVYEQSNGNVVACGSNYYYYGGGFGLMKENIMIINQQGQEVYFRSYDIGNSNYLIDWDLADDDEIYTLSTFYEVGNDSENTLHKTTANGGAAWTLTLSENNSTHVQGVLTKPSNHAGGAYVFGYTDNGDGLIISINDDGLLLNTLEIQGIPLYDGCFASTQLIAISGESTIIFLNVDGSIISTTSNEEFGTQQTNIAQTRDGGFLLSGKDTYPASIVKIGSTEALVTANSDPIPSEGGHFDAEVRFMTAMIRENTGLAHLSVIHQQYGISALEDELRIHLAPQDTQTFVFADSIDGWLPDGVYDVLFTMTSECGFIRTEASAVVQKGYTGIRADKPQSILRQFTLNAVYPNPFNSTTTIQFDLARPSVMDLRVFDLLGREVTVLGDKASYSPGTHRVVWDASGLPGGTYFLRAETPDEQQVRRMVFLK